MNPTPLAGLKVLDMSKVLAGPLCAQYLGDMGADVIKLEPLKGGDDTRQWPPLRKHEEAAPTGAIFLSANRNKRSIAVDLRSPEGLEVIERLVREVDVVIESYGPGVADRLGVGPQRLAELNPRAVCCSISGFGTVGPMKDGKGYDVILQAFCGWAGCAQPLFARRPGHWLACLDWHSSRPFGARAHGSGWARGGVAV